MTRHLERILADPLGDCGGTTNDNEISKKIVPQAPRVFFMITHKCSKIGVAPNSLLGCIGDGRVVDEPGFTSTVLTSGMEAKESTSRKAKSIVEYLKECVIHFQRLFDEWDDG